MSDIDLDDLASQLAEFDAPEKKSGRPPHEERIIAGFEDIQRFVEQHGRVPEHGEEKDIFERIYATRLERISSVPECRAIVTPLDHQKLLSSDFLSVNHSNETVDDDTLMAELMEMENKSEITNLKYVRTSTEKREAEAIANRERCKNFEEFRPLFSDVTHELATGARISLAIHKEVGFLKADIKVGEFFILFGQTAYVAEVGEEIRAPNGELDARLRVIYSNGTESNLLLRSLQRALYKDETSRRISKSDLGPLFDSSNNENDLASGTVYVLQSKSDHPTVTAHREVLHKIGVTGGDVKRRLNNAHLEPTFLMAEVHIVATYELFNINRTRLETLIHRIFCEARLDIEVEDRFGHIVSPREWFLVPLYVIDEVIEKIRAGTIINYVYDAKSASLVRSDPPSS